MQTHTLPLLKTTANSVAIKFYNLIIPCQAISTHHRPCLFLMFAASDFSCRFQDVCFVSAILVSGGNGDSATMVNALNMTPKTKCCLFVIDPQV